MPKNKIKEIENFQFNFQFVDWGINLNPEGLE